MQLHIHIKSLQNDTQHRAGTSLLQGGCSAALQRCPHSLPLKKVLALVIWGLIRYSHGLGIYLSLECGPREDPAASEASVNGDPDKECSLWCSWHNATFFLPLAFVKVNETNLLGVSFAVCSKLWGLWLRPSPSLMMNVCLNDKKVIDSGERRLEYPQLWPSI